MSKITIGVNAVDGVSNPRQTLPPGDHWRAIVFAADNVTVLGRHEGEEAKFSFECDADPNPSAGNGSNGSLWLTRTEKATGRQFTYLAQSGTPLTANVDFVEDCPWPNPADY